VLVLVLVHVARRGQDISGEGWRGEMVTRYGRIMGVEEGRYDKNGRERAHGIHTYLQYLYRTDVSESDVT
jgi:hypothetical protein